MHENDSSTNLGAALRALPLLAPERSAWPALQARLAARRRRAIAKRWVPALAAAALIALAVAPLLRKTAPAGPATTTTASAPAAAQPDATLAKLIDANRGAEARRRLQRGLSSELDGDAALASAQLEDLVGLVDVQLQSVSDPKQSAALWQRRLDLVNTLTRVESQGSLSAPMLAQEGGSLQQARFELN